MTKRIRASLGASCVAVSVALLAASAPAAAAKKPISGKLSKPGYTVIALSASGTAKAVRAKRGKFRLRHRAKVVTLHLRAPNGIYAGPVVVERTKGGKQAVLGVKAGAKLGKVKIKRGKGYAKVKRKLPRKFVDAKRQARAKKGVPIGAGKFGRVRSKKTHGGAPGDFDLDGIPEPLDIDDDGDKVLDDNDPATAARASQAQDEFHSFTRLTLNLDQTVNANAAGLTDAQIDAAVSSASDLLISVLPGDSTELDCGDANTGLPYCRPGGTGRIFQPAAPGGEPFPACCDPDGDGFGTLTPDPNVPPHPGLPGMTLRHGATTAQIGTGDVLIQRVTTGGAESAFPSTQQYVFATVSALISYTDGQGNSATVSYPVAGPNPGPGGPGTIGNGFPVAAGPGGDAVVTLTYWRPQRTPIPGEPGYGTPGAWTDIGGLVYSAALAGLGFRCPQSTLSESDPNLIASPSPIPALSNNQGGFIDQAADQPANPANTFTYTVNLTQCLAARGLSFNSAEERGFELQGITPTFGGVTIQPVFFERQ